MPEPAVRDIMDADPPTVLPNTDAEKVIRTLRDNEVHGVPVVDPDGHCVGIVTEADLVIAGDEGDLHLPHYLELFGGLVFIEPLRHFEERLRKAFASTAADLMTPDPLTVSPDTPAREAAHTIVETGHNRLPVVDEDGRLVGVVSRVDVLGALAR